MDETGFPTVITQVELTPLPSVAAAVMVAVEVRTALEGTDMVTAAPAAAEAAETVAAAVLLLDQLMVWLLAVVGVTPTVSWTLPLGARTLVLKALPPKTFMLIVATGTLTVMTTVSDLPFAEVAVIVEVYGGEPVPGSWAVIVIADPVVELRLTTCGSVVVQVTPVPELAVPGVRTAVRLSEFPATIVLAGSEFRSSWVVSLESAISSPVTGTRWSVKVTTQVAGGIPTASVVTVIVTVSLLLAPPVPVTSETNPVELTKALLVSELVQVTFLSVALAGATTADSWTPALPKR